MTKSLELFKDLFAPFEAIKVLHINHKVDFLQKTIDDVVESLNGSCDIKHFEQESDARLRATAREYEYIVLSDILSHCPNASKTVAQMYKALENSANIIILEKKSHHNVDEIKSLLDEASFVAINTIDLFEEYTIITAKKLHMWGSGL